MLTLFGRLFHYLDEVLETSRFYVDFMLGLIVSLVYGLVASFALGAIFGPTTGLVVSLMIGFMLCSTIGALRGYGVGFGFIPGFIPICSICVFLGWLVSVYGVFSVLGVVLITVAISEVPPICSLLERTLIRILKKMETWSLKEERV